jgi:4-hydroxy-2-oxoheptanedioate aldolase
MANIVRELWKQDKAAVNVFVTIPSGFATEMLAQAAWDAMTVDMQHGPQDFQSMMACVQSMQCRNVTPMVRVPANEPNFIGRALDRGAYGIICPLVNTRADAEALVSACRYPPHGTRSNGAFRPLIYRDAAGYMSGSVEDILVIPMIESRQAVENIDEILAVPGIDAIYIGPNDLGLSYGLGAIMEHEDPKVFDIYRMLLAKTKVRGIFAGIHCGTPAYARRMIELGFRLVTLTNDSRLMLNGANAALAVLRDKSAPAKPSAARS